MKMAFGILAAGLLLALQVPQRPIVFGPQADALRPADIEGIARAVARYGETPWLLTDVLRSPPMRNGEMQWIALAYLAPTTATEELRRGPLVKVHSELTTDAAPDPATWRADSGTIRTWAQVRLPNRPFGAVEGDLDENRPLHVVGDITDEDLLSIVRFLRSRPALANPRSSGPPVPGPVRTIWGPDLRHPYLPGARVTLGLAGGCGYDVLLQRRDDEWTGEIEGAFSCP